NALDQSADLLHSGEQGNWIRGVDVSEPRTAAEKAAGLLTVDVKSVEQGRQLENPDSLVSFEVIEGAKLDRHGKCVQGIKTGDDGKVRRSFWEIENRRNIWAYYQSTFEIGRA